MKFIRSNSYTLISTAIAGACAIAIAGCLPATGGPTLYYQLAPWTGPGITTTINRWNSETGITEVVAPEWGYPLLQQPGGSNFLANRGRAPDGIWSLHVAGNPTPLPNLGSGRGRSIQWAPDGKHILLQQETDIIVMNPDGTNPKVVGTVNRNPANRYADDASPSFSLDGTRIAYSRRDVLEVVNVRTNAKVTFPSLGEGYWIFSTRWLEGGKKLVVQTDNANNTDPYFIFDLQNVAIGEEAFVNRYPPGLSVISNQDAWSSDGDRKVEQFQPSPQADISYQLVFADNRPNVPLLTVPAGDNNYGSQRWPAWSNDGERLAYITDIDADGDSDVVIASKDGAVVQTFVDFGQVRDATLSWSPDDSKLAVTINAKPVSGVPTGSTRGRLITFDGGVVTDFAVPVVSDNIEKSGFVWSPNSRYFVHGYQYASGVFGVFATNPYLIDTQNLGVGGVSLIGSDFAWSHDSSYLGINQRSNTSNVCSIAVTQPSDRTHTITPVAQDTSCQLFWTK